MNPARKAAVPGGPPRLVVAGLSGDSGKTIVSVALLLEAGRRGIPVRAFKKGPDYIDAAWLAWASGSPARNLDTFLMGFDRPARSFALHAVPSGCNLIEGNRGLYDGVDASGSHSTGSLAKSLRAPVVLVLNATKMTRTAAALVLGCQKLDPEVPIAGVILNQTAGARHSGILRDAIESACNIPVLGAIPKLNSALLPSRHLGLVPPAEHSGASALAQNLLDAIRPHIAWDRLFEISGSAPPLHAPPLQLTQRCYGTRLRIGYVTDSAFTFYYPENLEALEREGAGLIPLSALASPALPDSLDGLYIGGGFPETHAATLAANSGFLNSIRHAARVGLPIYAECGGLMLLARGLLWRSQRSEMAAVLPFDVEVCPSPQGHGYTKLSVDTSNPFFPLGFQMLGHEFHYSRILAGENNLPSTVCALTKGEGCFQHRDGIVANNVWASYTHLHALATPEWARAFLAVVRRRALVAA
jgi:cobyrinic acid a,c-diamide synthase